MTGLYLPPAAETASSDASSSNQQYTPVSGESGEGTPTVKPKKSPVGPLRLQTNFDEPETSGPVSDVDGKADNSGDELEGKDARAVSAPKYSPEEERDVVRVFDRKLVPFLALLYLLSFLDRSNIGNAKIAGLQEELRLSSAQYEWVLTAFYITYILFEWMTLMYRLVPPHIYISLCVCGWGLVASFQCLATSFGGLVVLRALLGITEAAFGPGVPFYLSLFYRRDELAFRNGLFISAAPLATTFASSLAWLIVKLSSNGPISPWRILFLVEGFPSVIVAAFAWAIIPDSPGKARFLTRRQRVVARLRLGEDKSDYQQSTARRFNWREVVKTAADPKAYLAAFMFFSCNVAFSSMPVFLPTIIKDMGYSSLNAQALSAPPYLVAFVVVLATAYTSDRTRTRSSYLIAHALISSLSYLCIAATGYFHTHLPQSLHTAIRYICVYPAVSGFFAAITLIITWSMDNRVEKEGKGASIAILNLIGQCGPLLGTRLYPETDGPWYVRGMAICAFFMAGVAVLAGILRVLLVRANRAAGMSDAMGEADGEYGGAECEELIGGGRREDVEGRTGDQRFVYIL
ncbi:Major facilitator superfamily domain general substrate transporter [Penicillium capsulatum]|uniref:Major facilitator superfamily domain general substrate transporter n=1 Tax=Penicillium capsulatum TaxID=69766 RepID=A0A9W9I3C1_9EURO|nr:Major facilitator superfamily domain general substrate transporter [Penicillium capsulatum]KAJ6108869.1 Major facilitator superfamily domain general substrate transporter [Penicillium capsulatum]